MKKTYLALLLTAATAPAFAQQAAVDETLTITASRTDETAASIPSTVTVIDGESLRRQLSVANSLSDILGNLLPSFSPSRQKMTSAGESLRGREPLYLIDGVPQSNPLRNGSRDANTIDPMLIERVEVIHGASAIQGMGASGGIINIVTKSAARGQQNEVSAGVSAPTSETSTGLSYHAGYLFRHQAQDWNMLIGAHLRENGMYVDGNGDLVGIDSTQGDTMDSGSFDVFAKLQFMLDSTQQLQVMVNHYDIQGNGDYNAFGGDRAAGEPTISIEQPVPGDAAENRVTTASATYQNRDILHAELTWQLFLQDFSALYGGGTYATFQDPALPDNFFDQSRNDSQKYGSRLTLSWRDVVGTPVDISTGIDYLNDSTYQELAQSGRKWVPETEFDNWAPYLQARYQQNGLTLSAGLRYEYGQLKVGDFTTLASYGSQFVEGGEPSFNELLSNVGAVYQLTDNWRVFASYSEGFSMADIGRVLRGINQPNQSVESFLNLQPVLADNREVGIEYHGNLGQLSLSYFESDSDLGSRLQADADGIYSVKRERTEINGIEASGRYALATNADVGFNYANTDGEYDSNADGKVDTDLSGQNIAPERMNIYWNQQWSDRIGTRLQWNKLFSRAFNDGTMGANDFDGYSTWDLTALIETANYGEFTVGIENLTDKFYFTYYAQTAGNDSRNFAGRGRVVSVNWQYAW